MIYLLSKNIRVSCEQLCDHHLSESIVDTGMALSFYLWKTMPERVAFDAAHYFNTHTTSDFPRALYPMRGHTDLYEWILGSENNYAFLSQYLSALLDEYLYRFSKHHKFTLVYKFMPKMGFLTIAYDKVIEKRIEACVNLYQETGKYLKWTNRDKPEL